MATANSTTEALPKFTWLFLATYANPKAMPTVLRTQADTEADARQQLEGDYTLTFAAKINTTCTVNCHFWDDNAQTTWGIMAYGFDPDDNRIWGDNRVWEKQTRKELAIRLGEHHE